MSFQEKEKVKVLYKDKADINQKTKYLENSKELANLIKKAKEENNYSKYFIGETNISNQEYKPNHNECDMNDKSPEKVTEKRICRCMYYYNKDIDKCSKCLLRKKYNNVSNRFKVIDYEVPTKYVIDGCGGIDILLEDTNSKEVYAVEVKPQNSTETLVRKVAESYTYLADGINDYKKAIAFFSGSQQEKAYFNEKYRKNEDFKYIFEDVTVFRIVEKNKKDDVVDYEFEMISTNE